MADATPLAPRAAEHTWEDFVALDEDDPRELIDGEFVEVEVPTELHEHVVACLVFFLKGWARARRAGRVLTSGYKVKVSTRRGVMPDVQFYRTGNPADRRPTGLESGRPDLAVEVVSPSSRRIDRAVKLRWYAAIGVPEYWIVDPESQTLEQLALHERHYSILQSLDGDATFRPATFDGLEIPLAELWEPSDSETA